MDAISKNLVSIEWWLGVVAVGILLNLVSAYLKPWLDRTLSAFSTRWDERTSRRREERTKLVQYLRDHPDEQLHMLATEMRCRLRTILHLVLGMAILIISFIVAGSWGEKLAYWFSLLIIFMALSEHRNAMRYLSLVSEAGNRAQD